jgi:hypothetical protein
VTAEEAMMFEPPDTEDDGEKVPVSVADTVVLKLDCPTIVSSCNNLPSGSAEVAAPKSLDTTLDSAVATVGCGPWPA